MTSNIGKARAFFAKCANVSHVEMDGDRMVSGRLRKTTFMLIQDAKEDYMEVSLSRGFGKDVLDRHVADFFKACPWPIAEELQRHGGAIPKRVFSVHPGELAP